MRTKICGNCAAYDPMDPRQGVCCLNPGAASVVLVPVASLARAQQELQPQNYTARPAMQANQWCLQWQSAPKLLVEH
jgi:hypothetical protein